MTYTSSRDRLQSLPDVFSMALLEQTQGLSSAQAKVYVGRWMKAGLVQGVGPRAGMYYNLSQTSVITDQMKTKALLSLYPSAVLMGESVLHAWGWITQIPQHLSVAVLSQPTLKTIDGVVLHPRPRSWFKKHFEAMKSGGKEEATAFGLKSIPPAWALVDLYQHEHTWKPDADDLELDDDDVLEALKNLPKNMQDMLPAPVQVQLQDGSNHHKFRL